METWKNTLKKLESLSEYCPKLYDSFSSFMHSYYDLGNRENLKLHNNIIFKLENEYDFYKCILYYISGMTDNFAIEVYNEIIGF